MTDFTTFAQEELQDLDLSSFTDGGILLPDDKKNLNRAIKTRRDQFIERQLATAGFETSEGRRQARSILESRIPIPGEDEPRFRSSISSLRAPEPVASEAVDAAPVETGPQRRVVRDTAQTTGVEFLTTLPQAAAGLGEAVTRFLTPRAKERDSKIIAVLEDIQLAATEEKERLIPEATKRLREENARIGAEQGALAQIGDFITKPELVGGLFGTSAGLVAGSGGPAGSGRTLATRFGAGGAVSRLKQVGAALPKNRVGRAARAVANQLPSAARIGAASAEINADEVYRSIKEMDEGRLRTLPDYIEAENILRSIGKNPSHDQVVEHIARKAERTAAKYGFAGSFLALSLPGGQIFEKGLFSIPRAAIGRSRAVNDVAQEGTEGAVRRFLRGFGAEAISEGIEEGTQAAAAESAIRSLVRGETPFFEELTTQDTLQSALLGAGLGGIFGGSISLATRDRDVNERLEQSVSRAEGITDEPTLERNLRDAINDIQEAAGAARDEAGEALSPDLQAAYVKEKAMAHAAAIGLEGKVEGLINEAAFESRGLPVPQGQKIINDTDTSQETDSFVAEAAREDDDVANGVQFGHDQIQIGIEQALGRELPPASRFGPPHHSWTDSVEGTVVFSSDEFAVISGTDANFEKVSPSGNRSELTPEEIEAVSVGQIAYSATASAEPLSVAPAFQDNTQDESFIGFQNEQGGLQFREATASRDIDGNIRILGDQGVTSYISEPDVQFAADITKRVGDFDVSYRALDEGLDPVTVARDTRPAPVKATPQDTQILAERNLQDEIRAQHNPEYKQLRELDNSSDEPSRQRQQNARLFSESRKPNNIVLKAVGEADRVSDDKLLERHGELVVATTAGIQNAQGRLNVETQILALEKRMSEIGIAFEPYNPDTFTNEGAIGLFISTDKEVKPLLGRDDILSELNRDGVYGTLKQNGCK